MITVGFVDVFVNKNLVSIVEESMSRTMNLGCLTCKEHIWIGQNDYIYTAEPHTMEALRAFLVKHRTGDAITPSEGGDFDFEHTLIYKPELFDPEWTEIDTDQYRTPTNPKEEKD